MPTKRETESLARCGWREVKGLVKRVETRCGRAVVGVQVSHLLPTWRLARRWFLSAERTLNWQRGIVGVGLRKTERGRTFVFCQVQPTD